MAAATYTEDLTDLNTAEVATGWLEFSGTIGGEAYNTNGAPAGGDGDYPFIQGSYSVTQDCGKDTSIGSLAYNNSTGTGGHGTDGAYFVWQNYMVASNIGTYAQGGMQVCVGSGGGDFKAWYVGGVDKSPYPYGGWVNHAINTTVTADGTAGTPTATEQYIGAAVYVVTGSSKGEVHNVDVIRYGRGSAIFQFGDLTNGYATIAGFAAQNDNSSNRWGLIQETAGGYLWKGRMQLGTATNAVDFRDSNVTIFIQWTPKVTANFNLIECINASSNIEMTGFQFVQLDTTTASKGRFLMTNQCDVSLDSCVFNDMDTFVFDKGGTKTVDVIDCTFARCGQITQGLATITGAFINKSTASTSLVVNDISEVTGNTFISDGSNHAVDLGSYTTGTSGTPVTTGITWDNIATSYASGSTGSPITPTSTGNEIITVNVGQYDTLNISVAAGATVPSIRNTASTAGTINVIAGQVDLTLDGLIANSEVRIYTAGTTTELDGIENSGTSFVYTYTYVASTFVDIVIHHVDYQYYRLEDVLLGSSDATLPINQIFDRNYSNP